MNDGQSSFSIPSDLVEYLLLGPTEDKRQLQDSPILGDVWLAYAASPAEPQDLLITPHMDSTAAEVAGEIMTRIEKADGARKRKHAARIAYLQGIAAARLYFDDVLRVVVPLTQWWYESKILAKLNERDYEPARLRKRIGEIFSWKTYHEAESGSSPISERVSIQDKFSALDRYIALAGLILWAGKQGQRRGKAAGSRPRVETILREVAPRTDEILEELLAMFKTIAKEQRTAPVRSRKKKRGPKRNDVVRPGEKLIFQVSLNRRAANAMDKSVPAVKADAARTLFDVNCSGITWAVLDSGIAIEHEAFMLKDKRTGKSRSRIRKTMDFTRLRDVVSSDNRNISDARLIELLDGVDMNKKEARGRLAHLAEDARNRRPVNWDVVEELITVARPPTPKIPHGTHVAGIIGADRYGNGKDSGYAGGMCPDIRLYDFRVLARTLDDTEFAVIAALQYIRYINEQHNFITIHGANLSLSIPHSVRNYACGRTPVCVECERLVESGVVVVAAAGNRGYQHFRTEEGVFEGYAAFSVTDPGNADGVITVGATHGDWPHTYGVSFFSSRGPTGDGRLKPDLVAPGERIQGTVPPSEWGAKSGTSMAAPHVSGAAAMLMARYSELIGQPRRIKQILCENATDLGRERSFQGHGMLDVLRAFQAI